MAVARLNRSRYNQVRPNDQSVSQDDRAPRSAKNSYIAVENPYNLGIFVEISAKCFNAHMAFTKGMVDTSTFGSGDATGISTIRHSTFYLDAFTDQELEDLLFNVYICDRPCRIRYAPFGNTSGGDMYEAWFNMTIWENATNVRAAITAHVDFSRTGRTIRTEIT